MWGSRERFMLEVHVRGSRERVAREGSRGSGARVSCEGRPRDAEAPRGQVGGGGGINAL